jgi:deoxyadenosine/deoxycytidine kinase
MSEKKINYSSENKRLENIHCISKFRVLMKNQKGTYSQLKCEIIDDLFESKNCFNRLARMFRMTIILRQSLETHWNHLNEIRNRDREHICDQIRSFHYKEATTVFDSWRLNGSLKCVRLVWSTTPHATKIRPYQVETLACYFFGLFDDFLQSGL